MVATIRDIAEKTGYSVATVSRALGNYGYVSKEKREVILECAKKMQYTPNMLARSMIKRQTKTIGIVIADIHDPFYIDIIDKIEDLSNDIGYSVLLCNSNESAEREAKNIRTLLERMVDGIIMVPVSDSGNGRQRFEELSNRQVPFVFIDRMSPYVETDVVMLDNFNTASRSMGLLIDKGYKNIGVVYDRHSPKERTDGIVAACEAKGYQMTEKNWICCSREPDGVFHKLREYLAVEKCDALLTLENIMTVGTLKAINELKLELNKDIYVLGFDDIRLYNQLIPQSIGVIHQPVGMLCKYAMEMLCERINGGRQALPRVLRLEGEIRL